MTAIHTSYFICATPRCGSNFLCEVLQSTGVAGRPDEYFWNPPHWIERWKTSDFAGYLAGIRQEGSGPNGVFGLKIMADHLFEVGDKIGDVTHTAALPLPQRLETAFPHPRYVWLRRRDTLRQAISFHRAIETGAWRSTDESNVAPSEMGFDFGKIDGYVGYLIDADCMWDDYFTTNAIETLTIFYEDLAAAPEAVAKRILGFLNIAIPEPMPQREWQHQRQADGLTEAWVRRYHEAKCRLMAHNEE